MGGYLREMAESSEEGPALARIDFSEADEAQMHRLAWAMGIVGLFQSVLSGLGLLLALWGVTQLLGHMGQSPFAVLIGCVLLIGCTALPLYQGIVLREAGEYFGKVASTDDDDQEYLGAAFRRLRVVFLIEAVLAIPLALRMI